MRPQNRAVSKISLISRGLTTPRADVTTMATATTRTRLRYGANDFATRRTMFGWIGLASGSGILTRQ